MSVSFLKKLKMCKFELTLSHVQLRRTQSRSYTGCRSEKDFANPCETSVFRSSPLRPYAPLRRTRSANEFAGFFPSEKPHFTISFPYSASFSTAQYSDKTPESGNSPRKPTQAGMQSRLQCIQTSECRQIRSSNAQTSHRHPQESQMPNIPYPEYRTAIH